MATDEEILSEERLGDELEVLLYNIALRQDELGRQHTSMLQSKLEGDPRYQELIAREFLTFQPAGRGGTAAVVNLIVTLKGLRYCVLYADEIEPRRQFDAAGVRRVRA